MAEGTITIPPNSTVELPLGDLLIKAMEENNSGIASAKKLTLSNDKLRLKTEKNAELTRQAMVRVGALRREADYSPEQLIEWGKTREQGNTMPKEVQRKSTRCSLSKKQTSLVTPSKSYVTKCRRVSG